MESNEKREDEIIKNLLVSDPEKSYLEPGSRFLVLGAAHDLKDNVLKWNKENPDKAVSLVTFTPKSLKDIGR